ncbi:zinc finger BED domain-containing protein 4-like [Drosophila navojoa]|uniref:zinc finger BED domain-containing protein 4-like n=1 Tax=Drosophila navojoa TaxID=7232 RepID=UPI0011BF2756|nr:zinc finger BED domain-containing protein 4-like [Drosophila navojoa]
MDRSLLKGKRLNSTQACDSSFTDSDKNSTVEKPIPKKKKRISEVWKYFKKSDDRLFARCLCCGKLYKTSGNTSNIRDHLKRFHSNVSVLKCSTLTAEASVNNGNNKDTNDNNDDNDDTDDNDVKTDSNNDKNDNQDENGNGYDKIASSSGSCRSMSSVESCVERALLYDTKSKRKRGIDRALTEMIVKDMLPYTIAENEGFIKYTHVLDPRYKLPSSTHLRDVLMLHLFKETSAKLAVILENVPDIAITCDLWTSSTNVSFLSVTGHFVLDYSPKTVCLARQKLIDSTDHSAQNIANTLQDILSFWNILDKTVCAVTKNSSSMLEACEILKIQNHPCFAHTLNLVVQDGLKLEDDAIKALFAKCKTIVKFFKQSSISNNKFKKVQENLASILLEESPSRWNSFHFMIERILETHEAINAVLLPITSAPLTLSLEEINILKDVEIILSLFQKASDKISGENYVSLVIPVAYGLFLKVQDLSSQLQTSVGERMKYTILKSITKRLSTYEQRTVTRMATILDPRFKKNGFQLNTNAEKATIFLQHELANFTNRDTPINLNWESNRKTEDSLLDFLNQPVISKQENEKSDAFVIKRKYLETPLVPQKTDPFLWMKASQMELPFLKPLLFKYLCIPATSVESERLLRKAEQIASDGRTRPKEENLNVLLFLNQNLWIKSKYKALD